MRWIFLLKVFKVNYPAPATSCSLFFALKGVSHEMDIFVEGL
jgi:hypothetical protein